MDIPIKSIIQLRQDTVEGSTLEITYDLRGTGLNYKTAMNLAIFPKNTPSDVERCCELLSYDKDSKFMFKKNPKNTKKA